MTVEKGLAGLLARLTGDLRAELQYRLAQATRQLVRTIEAQYGEATGRLERAVAKITQTRTAADEDASPRDRELADRLAAIDRVIGQLKPEI